MLVDRLVGIERHALAHRILDPHVVSATLLGDTGDVGRGIVGDLFAQVAGNVRATTLDGMRRADIGAWRHGQDVGRFADEYARRGGARTRWRDVDNRRYGAVQQILDHLTHRGIQATRRIHDQHEQRRAPVGGRSDDTVDVLRGHGIDYAGQVGNDDGRAALSLTRGRYLACRGQRNQHYG